MNRPVSPFTITLTSRRPSPWPAERFAIGAVMLAAIVGAQFIAWLAV